MGDANGFRPHAGLEVTACSGHRHSLRAAEALRDDLERRTPAACIHALQESHPNPEVNLRPASRYADSSTRRFGSAAVRGILLRRWSREGSGPATVFRASAERRRHPQEQVSHRVADTGYPTSSLLVAQRTWRSAAGPPPWWPEAPRCMARRYHQKLEGAVPGPLQRLVRRRGAT